MNNFWRTILSICTPGHNDPAQNFYFKPVFEVVTLFDPKEWPKPVNDNNPPDDKQWPA